MEPFSFTHWVSTNGKLGPCAGEDMSVNIKMFDVRGDWEE